MPAGWYITDPGRNTKVDTRRGGEEEGDAEDKEAAAAAAEEEAEEEATLAGTEGKTPQALWAARSRRTLSSARSVVRSGGVKIGNIKPAKYRY